MGRLGPIFVAATLLLVSCASPITAQQRPSPTPTIAASAPTAPPMSATATPLPLPTAPVVTAGPTPVSIPTLDVTEAATIPAAATPLPAGPSAPASPTRIDTIQSAFTILMDTYYRQLSSSDLLKAAWLGAVDEAFHTRPTGNLATPAFTGNRESDFKLFQTKYDALFAGNSTLDPVQVSFAAVQSMASSLSDDHTAFLTPDVYARFQQQSSGGTQSVGLGIVVGGTGPPYQIQEVVPGAPAEKAGVKAGDAIVQVNGKDVAQIQLTGLTQLLRGDAGSTVQLGLRRQGGTTVQISVTRAAYVVPVLQSRILPNGVGYLRLLQFPETYIKFADGKTFQEELDADLASFEQAGVKVWVVDLRDNPGGSVASLAQMAGRFIPDGQIVVSVGRGSDREETLVDGHLYHVQRPLAVLINGGSASSSELFAASIQDYKRGIVVGQESAGAVNAAQIFPLPDGSAIQVTVAQALTGKGNKALDGTGVRPDVTVNGASTPGGNDPQLDRASALLLAEAAKTPTLALQSVPPVALPSDQLQATLGPVLPDDTVIPPGDDRRLAGSQTIDTVNEFVGGSTDAAQLKTTVAKRGWLGTIQLYFGAHDPPTYSIGFDLYKDATGAKEAITTNDYPNQYATVTPPIALGDDTVAYKGINSALGSTAVGWRRGRVVLSVVFVGEPGKASFDTITSIARAVDAQYSKHPVP